MNHFKKLGFLIFLIMCMEIADAQDVPKSFVTRIELQEQAKSALLHKEYDKAFNLYKRLDWTGENLGPNELHNLLKLAVQFEDIILAEASARKLIELGICPEYFDQFGDFKAHLNQNQIFTQTTANYNFTYRVFIDSLFMLDQQDRRGRSSQENWARDSIHNEAFLAQFDRFGLPSYQKVGITCSSSLKGFQSVETDLLFVHFTQGKHRRIKEVLKSGFLSGSLPVRKYLRLLKLSGTKNECYTNPIIRIDGEYYAPISLNDKEKRMLVNAKRKQIGLMTIEKEISLIVEFIDTERQGFRYGDFFFMNDLSSFLTDQQVQQYFVKVSEMEL